MDKTISELVGFYDKAPVLAGALLLIVAASPFGIALLHHLNKRAEFQVEMVKAKLVAQRARNTKQRASNDSSMPEAKVGNLRK